MDHCTQVQTAQTEVVSVKHCMGSHTIFYIYSTSMQDLTSNHLQAEDFSTIAAGNSNAIPGLNPGANITNIIPRLDHKTMDPSMYISAPTGSFKEHNLK